MSSISCVFVDAVEVDDFRCCRLVVWGREFTEFTERELAVLSLDEALDEVRLRDVESVSLQEAERAFRVFARRFAPPPVSGWIDTPFGRVQWIDRLIAVFDEKEEIGGAAAQLFQRAERAIAPVFSLRGEWLREMDEPIQAHVSQRTRELVSVKEVCSWPFSVREALLISLWGRFEALLLDKFKSKRLPAVGVPDRELIDLRSFGKFARGGRVWAIPFQGSFFTNDLLEVVLSVTLPIEETRFGLVPNTQNVVRNWLEGARADRFDPPRPYNWEPNNVLEGLPFFVIELQLFENGRESWEVGRLIACRDDEEESLGIALQLESSATLAELANRSIPFIVRFMVELFLRERWARSLRLFIDRPLVDNRGEILIPELRRAGFLSRWSWEFWEQFLKGFWKMERQIEDRRIAFLELGRDALSREVLPAVAPGVLRVRPPPNGVTSWQRLIAERPMVPNDFALPWNERDELSRIAIDFPRVRDLLLLAGRRVITAALLELFPFEVVETLLAFIELRESRPEPPAIRRERLSFPEMQQLARRWR